MTFQELLDDERAWGREEGIEIGRKQGHAQGLEQGRTLQLRELVQKKLAKNKSIEQIAEELEEDASIIEEIMRIASYTEKVSFRRIS